LKREGMVSVATQMIAIFMLLVKHLENV
jgi:hypothetical protein